MQSLEDDRRFKQFKEFWDLTKKKIFKRANTCKYFREYCFWTCICTRVTSGEYRESFKKRCLSSKCPDFSTCFSIFNLTFMKYYTFTASNVQCTIIYRATWFYIIRLFEFIFSAYGWSFKSMTNICIYL